MRLFIEMASAVRGNYSALEKEVLTLLPRVEHIPNLEEIAYVLGVEIPEEIRENARSISRHIRQFVDSNQFDSLPNQEEILLRVIRMIHRFLGLEHEVAYGAGGGSEVEVEQDDGSGGGDEGNVDEFGLLIPAASTESTAHSFISPPRLSRATTPFPQSYGFLNSPRPLMTSSRMRAPGVSSAVSQPFTFGASAFGFGAPGRTRAPHTTVTNTYRVGAPQASVFGVQGLRATSVPLSVGVNQPVSSNVAFLTPRGQNLNPLNPFSPYHPSNMKQSNPGNVAPGSVQANLLPQFNMYAGLANPAASHVPVVPSVPNPSTAFGYVPPSVVSTAATSHMHNPYAAYPYPTWLHSTGLPGVSPTLAKKAFGKFRELKINGQIGEPGEAGKLSYSSLSYQIHSAQERGYDDADILNAVIRAITPNLSLRNHLEKHRDMPLTRLVSRLRTHFLLKSAATAFTDMGNMVQKVGDTEINFCMDLMGMRDDVIALSKEEGGQYTDDLVQEKMIHVLSVGLRKASIRLAMRPLLKTPHISDDDIFDALKDLVLNEAEHSAKADGASAVATTNASTKGRANTLANTAATVAACSELSLNKTDMLIGEVQQLARTVNQLSTLPSELQKLKKEVSQQKQQTQCSATEDLDDTDNTVIVAQATSTGSGNGRGNGSAPPTNMGRGGFSSGAGRGKPQNGGNNNMNSRVGKQVTTTIRKCEKCGEVGPGIFWDHCFICCGKGHQMSECPKNEEG